MPGNSLTVGIVVAIISGLFFFQRFGTHLIGKAFGPIMAIWFTMLLVAGLSQIVHYPDVLRALSRDSGCSAPFSYVRRGPRRCIPTLDTAA